jgi:hypothetical protein
MKIRKGFVSNSSSSSFIISGNIEQDKMVVSLDLSKFGTLIKTKEQLKEYYIKEWGEYDEDDRRVEQQLELLAKGQAIFCGYMENELLGILDYVEGDLNVHYDY